MPTLVLASLPPNRRQRSLESASAARLELEVGRRALQLVRDACSGLARVQRANELNESAASPATAALAWAEIALEQLEQILVLVLVQMEL